MPYCSRKLRFKELNMRGGAYKREYVFLIYSYILLYIYDIFKRLLRSTRYPSRASLARTIHIKIHRTSTQCYYRRDPVENDFATEVTANSKRPIFVLQLIFSGEYTKAMNKDWHSGHFCCWQCDESLTGQRYVLRDEHPYCIKCYESVFANGCEECNKIIGIDSKVLFLRKHTSRNFFKLELFSL